ncbi:MAG: CHASE domain-containing sensor histidine kinase [Pseudomonadota bacterium]
MRAPAGWPVLVLLAGLAVTAVAVALTERANRRDAQRELEERAQLVVTMVERRIGRWSEVLNGVRGLYAASERVSASEFHEFFTHLDLPSRHAGFLSLQYIARVPHDDRAAFEAAVQGDGQLMAGRPAVFGIHPPGDRPEYLVTLYIEPRAGNGAAFGFDAAHDATRRQAFDRARDSGGMVASGPLPLVQRGGALGLALRLPIYRNGEPSQTPEQRRAAWVGVASAVLEAERFFGAIVDPALHRQVRFRLHDLGWADQARATPSPANLLFDSGGPQAGPPDVEAARVIELPVAGRRWRLDFWPLPGAGGVSGAGGPWTLALFGALASVLAWRLLQAQMGAKAALEARVHERTLELAAANRSLRAGEQRLELALAGGDLAIWDWDIASGRLVWNDRWWALRGLPPLQERPTLDVWQRTIHPDDLARTRQALQRHLDGQAPLYEVEYRVLRPDGSARRLLDRGRVVERDAEGRAARMSGTNLDVTDRWQAEEARVQAETARRLSAAKDEFVARMSHELRTPLNAILGFSGLLQLDREGLDERHIAHIDHIQRAGQHLLALLNDLLDFAAIESGRVPMQPEPQPVASQVREVLALLEPQAAEAGVSLAVRLPAAPEEAATKVLADRTRLTQVLLNLASNAIKYNRRGGRVDVGWSVHDGWARLAVRDTGTGLTPAQLERLYQPFERLAAAGSAIPGSGLGLVVTRRLVELMGGRIEVTSEPGEGSCFTVVLPLATA